MVVRPSIVRYKVSNFEFRAFLLVQASKVIGAETAMRIPLTSNDMIDAMIYRLIRTTL